MFSHSIESAISLPDPAPFGGPLSITSKFCGGNIVHVSTTELKSSASFEVALNINQDPYTTLEKATHSQVISALLLFIAPVIIDFDSVFTSIVVHTRSYVNIVVLLQESCY